MAKDFRQREDRDDNEKRSGKRNDIVGENESLPRRVRGLRTRGLRLRPWRRSVELRDLQLCRGDGRNGRQRNSQRRNRLGGGSADGHGIEARRDIANGPTPPGFAAERVTSDVEER